VSFTDSRWLQYTLRGIPAAVDRALHLLLSYKMEVTRANHVFKGDGVFVGHVLGPIPASCAGES